MRIWIATLTLIAVPSLVSAGADCKDPRARYEDLGCVSQALDRADKELNDTYKALLTGVDQEGKAKLKDAQRAWIQFRDADTALAYRISGEGGSLGGLIAMNHKLDLTTERTRQLKEFANAGGR